MLWPTHLDELLKISRSLIIFGNRSWIFRCQGKPSHCQRCSGPPASISSQDENLRKWEWTVRVKSHTWWSVLSVGNLLLADRFDLGGYRETMLVGTLWGNQQSAPNQHYSFFFWPPSFMIHRQFSSSIVDNVDHLLFLLIHMFCRRTARCTVILQSFPTYTCNHLIRSARS